jgi:hypothetical protein
MFRKKASKASPGAPERLFGKTDIRPESETLTATYRSSDWRDGWRLTFFRLAGEPVNDTPFIPGLTAGGAKHDAE